MHGKRENNRTELFSNRELALTVSKPGVGLLEVEWYRIINHGWDSFSFQMFF